MTNSYRQLFELHDQVAIVTGGGRGIGLAIAEGLGSFGAKIVIGERDPVLADNAACQLREQGIEAMAVVTDVTDHAQLTALFDQACAEFGELDILINNAGVSARIPAEDYPRADLQQMIDLNLTAVFQGMQEAARRWIAHGKGGSIINLASFAGVVADPLSAPYAATKGAVVQLTRTCAVEWAQHGIRVNAIGPGYVRTEMTAHTLDTPEAGAVIQAKTALARAARPDEMVGAAIYLASEASSYTTGHILMVDGGWTAM
ncbi:MAG: gluconate 5-dehydrogenase [Rickettsiales bacterium]|nr:gluconate 5-dehydrogenase [Rickettsiales bacterium]